MSYKTMLHGESLAKNSNQQAGGPIKTLKWQFYLSGTYLK